MNLVPNTQVKNTSNIRKSPNRKRIKINNEWVWISVRGTKRYFIYFFERYDDFYFLIIKDISYPIKIQDGFNKNDLNKVLDKEIKVLDYIKNYSKIKKISYSPSSLVFKI